MKRAKVAAAALLAAAAVYGATDIPPAPTRWVTDTAGFLSEGTRRALDARLEAYQQASGRQVIVWIGRTTGDAPIEDFAVKAFEAWKVGRSGMDDGLVLFIMADDRKIRFEVGYGLEPQLPDVIASRIIQEVMAPQMQAGNHDGAVVAGVQAALAAIGDAGAPARARRGQPQPLTRGQLIVLAILAGGFLLLLITHPSLAYWLLVNIASSGSSRGGYHGGGGFSGGGGRSGGGGATGSW